jgi:hypothetical protein
MRIRPRSLVLLIAAVTLFSVVGGATPAERPAGAATGSVVRPSTACSLRAQVVFWTANDWVPLGQELAKQLSPCADYYISLPPRSSDQTALRDDQDDVIRALGPQFHPLAEMRLGTATGWGAWVDGSPGRTWFDAGVEFRRRMAEAGYQPARGETWLLNEFDRSTRRDEPPYTRAAMRDLVRGLYVGDGSGPRLPGVVEIGIAYTHQNIPDVAGYKAEMKEWLEDDAFWSDVAPAISIVTKEVYPDARYWGVEGSTRNERARHLSEFMEHAMNLVKAGPASIASARSLFERGYMPLANATWPAKGPDPYTPPFCCGHGWTLISLDNMQTFVSEQIYAVRRYAGNHPQAAPRGRIGFSWQPTNNYNLPAAEWDSAKRAIAARIGEAIRFAYRPGLDSGLSDEIRMAYGGRTHSDPSGPSNMMRRW